MIYAVLGRSLWETGRLDILGQDAAFYSLIQPALIGLPLALFDTALGYDVARVLEALVMSLAAVPIFAWGRRLMSERWALAAAALTLCIPGLAYTGLLMSETIFYPLVALAAWLAARALTEPTLRTQALLVGAVLLVVLTRLQGVVLVPAFVLAVALYALAGRTRAPFVRLWPSLAALAVIGAGVALMGLGADAPAGSAGHARGDAVPRGARRDRRRRRLDGARSVRAGRTRRLRPRRRAPLRPVPRGRPAPARRGRPGLCRRRARALASGLGRGPCVPCSDVRVRRGLRRRGRA